MGEITLQDGTNNGVSVKYSVDNCCQEMEFATFELLCTTANMEAEMKCKNSASYKPEHLSLKRLDNNYVVEIMFTAQNLYGTTSESFAAVTIDNDFKVKNTIGF